jgi:hypothetical protein
LSTTDEKALANFEGKVLRSIYGPMKDNNERRIRYNYAFYGDMDIITFIIMGRLTRAGHIVRMGQQQLAKRILNAKAEGGSERRRPKLRWED